MDFANEATADIYNGNDTKAARKALPASLHEAARRKMTVIRRAASVDQLRVPPGNRLEALSGDRARQYSIRINSQYRICFTWLDDAAADLEVVDYH